jgi:hypothetical protein
MALRSRLCYQLNISCYIFVLPFYEHNFDLREEKAAMLAAAVRVKASLVAAIMSAEQRERDFRLVSVSASG